MATIRGRVDDNGRDFYPEDSTTACMLYVNEMQASKLQPYDLSDLAGQKVLVTCQTYSATTAYGVTDVSVDFDG